MADRFLKQRMKMVDSQIRSRGIKDQRVLAAMSKVPRHLFVAEGLADQAYNDNPLPIERQQTISQPYIVALMTEALELTGREKVLEIGCGSGYQTAILAELAEQVFTIERIPSIAKLARKVFDRMQYRNIVLTIRDGSFGWKEYSPYDRIIVTAASPSVPKPLLDQLAPQGRLVIPIGTEFDQELKVYEKGDDGELTEHNYGECRFVKLVGEHGWKK